MPLSIQAIGVNVAVADAEAVDGELLRVLLISDPQSGISIQAPLPQEEASRIASALEGRQIIAAPAGAVPKPEANGG